MGDGMKGYTKDNEIWVLVLMFFIIGVGIGGFMIRQIDSESVEQDVINNCIFKVIVEGNKSYDFAHDFCETFLNNPEELSLKPQSDNEEVK